MLYSILKAIFNWDIKCSASEAGQQESKDSGTPMVGKKIPSLSVISLYVKVFAYYQRRANYHMKSKISSSFMQCYTIRQATSDVTSWTAKISLPYTPFFLVKKKGNSSGNLAC